MKKHEKEQLKCNIKSTQLIAGQAIWECLGTLRYHLEDSKNIDTTTIENLIRKLNSAEENLNLSMNFIKTYFTSIN